jgi:COMPASS component SWD1
LDPALNPFFPPQIISQFRVSQQASSTTAVKGIEFARRSRSFLVNTADRVIRVYKTTNVFNLQDGKYVEIF